MTARVLVAEKHCASCETSKGADQYYTCPSQRDGLSGLCIPCTKESNRAYLAKLTPEQVAARREKSRLRAAGRRQDPAYRQQKRDWHSANPERGRESAYLRKYGITLADYGAMLAAQGGHCALCPATTGGGKISVLHVDHCHRTGKVRGLLCARCNTTLGKFGDDPDRLRAAVAYLEAHQ